MNQRQKRARDRRREKRQDLSGATLATGGHVAKHDRGKEAEVKVPKATGDVPKEKAKGLAKASPLFKKLKDAVKPASKSEEAKAIAEAKTEVKEEKSETKKITRGEQRPSDKSKKVKKDEKQEDDAS